MSGDLLGYLFDSVLLVPVIGVPATWWMNYAEPPDLHKRPGGLFAFV